MSDGSDGSPEVSYILPATLDAPGLARQFVSEYGADLDPDLLFDARLLVSELVTNAVNHGRPEITLHMRIEPPGIGVRVHDGSDVLPVVPTEDPDDDQTHGRGLRIVTAMATVWGVDTVAGEHGKTVWFDLRADQTAASPD